MKTRLLILPLAAALCACAVAPDDGIVEPSFDSKADFFTDIEASQRIEFGETVSGEFDRDFQFFAYAFRAREGAVITAEVTHRGSSSRLDTTLFLYRLTDDAPMRIALDDDAGYGALSKIGGFELYSEGEYALIIGTGMGAGRGQYTLALECDNGACASTVPEPACPLTAQAGIVECVEETTVEWGFEAELTEIATEQCATREAVEERDGIEDSATISACVLWAQRAYPPTAGRTTDLLMLAAEPAIDAIVARVNASDACSSGPDHGCEFHFRAYEYDTDYGITAEELMAHARLSLPPGPGMFPAQQTGDGAEEELARFMARYDIAEDVADIADTLGGSFSHAAYGSFGGDDVQWNYGDCGGENVVVDFFEEGLAFELTVFYCSG